MPMMNLLEEMDRPRRNCWITNFSGINRGKALFSYIHAAGLSTIDVLVDKSLRDTALPFLAGTGRVTVTVMGNIPAAGTYEFLPYAEHPLNNVFLFPEEPEVKRAATELIAQLATGEPMPGASQEYDVPAFLLDLDEYRRQYALAPWYVHERAFLPKKSGIMVGEIDIKKEVASLGKEIERPNDRVTILYCDKDDKVVLRAHLMYNKDVFVMMNPVPVLGNLRQDQQGRLETEVHLSSKRPTLPEMLDAGRRRKDISNASYYDGISDLCNTLMVEGVDAFVQKFGMHEAKKILFETYSRLRTTNPVCVVEIRP